MKLRAPGPVRRMALMCAGVAAGALLVAPLTARADEDEKAPKTGVKTGYDLYYGITNLTGPNRRSTDGVWAASGTAFPSVGSIDWTGRNGDSARVSLGVGDLYTTKGSQLHEANELYYRFGKVGPGSLTIGKFYTPFALQEWEYETKYGALYQLGRGAMTYTAALQLDTTTKRPNAYARVARELGAGTTLGLSGALGHGLTYGSAHDSAIAADLTHDFGFATASSEYVWADCPSGSFQFAFTKLALNMRGNCQPFVGAYYWHDSAGELGHFTSGIVGATYKLAPGVAVEAAYGRANGRHIYWLQSHLTSF